MTTPQIDKMEEFRAGRFAQIERLTDRQEALDAAVASGEAKRLEDGSYKILTGWDKNEILTAKGLPQHGLDLMQDGITPAIYSTNARPWWGVGTHLEDGLFSAKASLMAAGCDFEIVKRRARFLMDEDEHGLAASITDGNPLLDGEDDQFMVIRTDTKRSLGQVGGLWTPIQNVEAFAFMEEFGEPFETVGSFRGGKRVFATMQLPHDMTVDAEGINEQIKLYIAAINNHDGNGGVQLMVTPFRIECLNTERMAIKGFKTKWTIKHTPGYEAQLENARKTLKITDKYVAAWVKDENELARREITDREIAAVVADIWDVDEEEDGARRQAKTEARVMDIMDRWATERERCGKTAYALERALTGHVDHAGERRPRENKGLTPLGLLGVSILEDTTGPIKGKIHARTMALVGGK